jgi:hypothetical protein
LLGGWTIPFLKDHLVRNGFAKRSLLFVDSQFPLPGGRIEAERDLGRFPSDEEALWLVIPVELKWPLLWCVHYFSSLTISAEFISA